MRPVPLTPAQLPGARRVRSFEGGSVSIAEHGGKFYVVVDESTLTSLLDEEELAGRELVTVLEGDSEAERNAYLQRRFGATAAVAGDGTNHLAP